MCVCVCVCVCLQVFIFPNMNRYYLFIYLFLQCWENDNHPQENYHIWLLTSCVVGNWFKSFNI